MDMTTVTLRPTTLAEVDKLMSMERKPDAVDFLISKDRDTHVAEMTSKDGTYLSICQAEEMVGYLALFLDPDGVSVECRRIVIEKSGQGIGQLVMLKMEAYCKAVLGRDRVWLDFYDNNARGRHVYEKLGYREFDQQMFHGKLLRLYEKSI